MQLPAQLLKCSDLSWGQGDFVMQTIILTANKDNIESRKITDKKVPLNLLPGVFFTTHSMRKDDL